MREHGVLPHVHKNTENNNNNLIQIQYVISPKVTLNERLAVVEVSVA